MRRFQKKAFISIIAIIPIVLSVTFGSSALSGAIAKGVKISAFLSNPSVMPYYIQKDEEDIRQESKVENNITEENISSEVASEPPKNNTDIETGEIKTMLLSLDSANTIQSGVHISNKTGLSVDIPKLLEQGLPFDIKNIKEPQVLIVHTHATEAYTVGDYGYYIKSQNTRSRDNSKNVVRVGDVLADVLNKAGIVTINDSTQHDYPSYTGSYSRSAETIKTYLKKYPTIKVVIDLHRDAITQSNNVKIKPTTEIDGKKAAQIMLLCGAEAGDVTDFPNWKENLRFNLALQKQLENDYPDLCRPMLFKQCVYNFDLLNGSILIELGSEANTLEEAMYSAELLGNSLVKILK